MLDSGLAAERLACKHLGKQGLILVTRNYRCRRGEIDLIMRDAGTLVFVEVRYRNRTDFGSAAESVDRRKQQRIAYCAEQYLQAHPAHARMPCRFDVVAVTNGGRKIDWIANAFTIDA